MKSYCAYGDRAMFRCMRWGVCVVLFAGWASEVSAAIQWNCATTEAWESARYDHACVVFKDKIWVLGGYVDHCTDDEVIPYLEYLDDVWCSSNGKDWVRYSKHSCGGRYGHTAVVFQDRIWVMGGVGTEYMNDVWYSDEGGIWIRAKTHAAWSPRAQHTSVVFDNKMWILGGGTADVWSSEDGVNWTEVSNSAPWGEREEHTSVVFNNKMWVIGGVSDEWKNDVWSSQNGKDWIQETSVAEWPPKIAHTSVVCQNKIWIFGGISGGNWYSSNGATWTKISENGLWWLSRVDLASLEFQDTLWVLGGFRGGCNDYSNAWNDVWYMNAGVNCAFNASPLFGTAPLTIQFTDESLAFSTTITDWAWDFGDGTGSNEQNPSHIYAQRGLYTVSLTVASVDDSDTSVKEGYIRVAGEQHAFHSADADRNGRISLSELLRVIQFYNYGAFHCAVGTEDGYAPGPGGMACGLYDGDYAPPDGRLNLSEVLRVIQFFNMRGYRACLDGEDGFCPGGGGMN